MSNDMELEDAEAWDQDRAQKHEGRKERRAIVSVAFAREDFQAVVEAARRAGEATSEFIRRAALSRAQPLSGVPVSMSATGGGSGRSTFYWERPSVATNQAGRATHESIAIDGRQVVVST